jgi:hypothetical protein
MPGLSEATEAQIFDALLASKGAISPAEASAHSADVRQAMAVVAEVLTGAGVARPNTSEDWSDPADPGTWKKPLVEGER